VTEIFSNLLGVQAPVSGGGHFQGPLYIFWMSLASDTLIELSYYSAALALGYLAYRCRPLRVRWLVALLSIFLIACGTIHLLASLGYWQPDSRLDAGTKMLAAVLSVAGAGLLWHLVIRAIREPRQTTEQLQCVIRQLEHEVIERKHAEQELQKSRELLRELAAYQEQVKEDERKRIAREIHDELGQNLLALRIDVSMLHARTGSAHPKLNEKVRYVLAHIDSSIKAVRAIINNLRPSVLDLGLHAAIEWQVKEFERRTGIGCKLSMDDNKTDCELDDHRATALFRILQESLTNVARHAQATLVIIALRRDRGKYVMKITDNGVGIFPGCRRKPNSFGLLGIGERISTLGGEFKVDSLPGEGTTLTISIPVELAVVEP
jgi:signal transduction histidine kinase